MTFHAEQLLQSAYLEQLRKQAFAYLVAHLAEEDIEVCVIDDPIAGHITRLQTGRYTSKIADLGELFEQRADEIIADNVLLDLVDAAHEHDITEFYDLTLQLWVEDAKIHMCSTAYFIR